MRDYIFEILSIDRSEELSDVDSFTGWENTIYCVKTKCINDNDIISVFINSDNINDKEYIKTKLLEEKRCRDKGKIFLSCGDFL